MTSGRIDPATLAVMQNALRQIVNEMDLALERAAFTPIMSEARDRANGLYDALTGEVITQGDTGMPIFVGVMQFAVQSALADYPDLGPDDVVMLNDPYRGGTHLMDVKLVRPFFYRGERFAVLANCGHWTDIGGAVPGGFGVRATEIYQEGVRIPPVMLMRNGVIQEDLLKLLFANTRVPEERLGDLKAQIAAINVGHGRLTALLDKYGAAEVRRYMRELTERAEQLMRAYVAKIPDGDYSFETNVDSDGLILEPITVALDLKVRGSDIELDFSRSSAPVKGAMNGSLSATVSSVYVALKHIFPEVPINAGAFRPVRVNAPETTFLNAQFPKAVSGSSAEVSLRVVDAVFGALSQAIPEQVPAACFGSVENFTISGYDPESRKSYIMFRFSGGGYGGQPGIDGLSNGSAPISAARTSPIEVLEALYPIAFNHYRLREGSGGAGQFRGGFGVSFEISLLRGEAVSSVIGDRGIYPPFGVQGGGAGALAEVRYTLGGQAYRPQHVTKDEGVAMLAGDSVSIETPGGGGWGEPWQRDPAAVIRDLSLGLISQDMASRIYGVAAVGSGAAWQCDEAGTRKLRASRVASQPATNIPPSTRQRAMAEPETAES
ncbi:MAG: hydantoinase B/oxoprolinase family protein [Pseudorhodoplanes sp.]|uniref:hydantoinase B/oxoprolinase family protein n=1 Tax=Pseudorhodoplanes sp. TaxID=1934341 RepID=UPI003D0CD3AE